MEMQQLIRRTALRVLAGFAVFLAGCAHYTAKPLHPEQTLGQLQEKRLADERVIQRVRSLTGTQLGSEQDAEWGRAELLVAALELNPSVAEARARLALATAGVRTAHALQNPTLSLATEYDLSNAGEPSWLWGIGTNFLLDTFIARGLRAHVAQSGVRGAHADFAEAIWTVRRDLRLALLSTMVADRRIAFLERDAEQRAELARLAHSRIEVGEGARSEGLQADLELARSRAALDDARRVRLDARAKLALALGVAARQLDGVAFQWDDLDAIGPLTDDTLRHARDRALLSRPDLERAIADYETRDFELRQQVSAQYLQASLGPGYTWDHGVRKLTFGVSIALPIFNRNQGPIAEAVAAREVAGQHAMVVQSTVLNEIASAQVAYSNALEALAAVRAQLEASERLATSAQHAFDVDAADRPTLLAAQISATTERLAELDALERTQQALGVLEDAVRAPLAGPELKMLELE